MGILGSHTAQAPMEEGRVRWEKSEHVAKLKQAPPQPLNVPKTEEKRF